MAANWQHKGSGAWGTAANWVGNTVPTGGDVTLDYSQLSPFTAAYTVTIPAAASYGLSDLTIHGTSTTSVITLANNGTLVVQDQVELTNASLTDGKSLTVGTLGFNGDALLTLSTFATASGQVTSSGSANEVVQDFDSKFVGASANFGGPFTWLLQGGSQASFSGQVGGSGATFIFADNTADELTLGTGQGNQLFSAISSFSSGNEIDLRGLSFGTGGFTNNQSGTDLIISRGGQPQFTFDSFSFATGYTFSGIRYASDGNGGTIVSVVCYARGTMIWTPDGELPVEKLRPGKQVITLVDGQEVPQAVTWLGHRHIGLSGHPQPETVAPIRIQCDAFADGMPHRDLIVSPDHAIFVDGKLICARQLVNGSTIRQELDWTAVDYYHVELDQHAILLAEGLPAESYIDTGNSGFFENSGAPLVLHPDLTDETDYPTREAGACVPFVWDEANVRPVWQRLADRAAEIGQPMPQRATITDPDLRLRCKQPYQPNRKPVYQDGNLVIFVVPRGAREVRLISRAQSPTEARPWLDDRRRLGIRAKRLVLRGANELREIPMDHPDLTNGWWDIERDGQMMSRWTNGDAFVPLPKMDGHVMLEVHLTGSMTYVTDAVPEGETERCAA